MSSQVKGNLLIAQGGGPTPVINCSLYGVIRTALDKKRVGNIMGARHGITGLLSESFIDLRAQSRDTIESLRNSPAAALGSCRYKVTDEDYTRIIELLKKHDIRYFLYNGGNDSMDTADKVHRWAQSEGYELFVIGIPKTIDNDLALTDRCPGFGSGARYVAQSVRDVGIDVRSLPIPVTIFETMGRNAGWLAGSSVLARTGPDSAPHLVYLPERCFSTEGFIDQLDAVVRRLGWAVVVVSEGITNERGEPVYATNDKAQFDAFGHALPGNVGSYLAGLVSSKLKLRCRSEKPGICGRSSMLHVSPTDQQDAEQVGAAAVEAATSGRSGHMVTLLPRHQPGEPVRTGFAALTEVANNERLVPEDFITSDGADVTDAFADYVRPLIGPSLLEYVQLI